MKKEKKYCSFCGESISQKELDGKIRDFCLSCNSVFYENPLPVACSIVVNEEREVLLVKRNNEPYKDLWCLPIGFAESGEEVREAALRELKEEAGVDGKIIRLIDVDTIENYFYGSLAIVTYEVSITGGNISPGDDASEARFFPIDALPELAWSSNTKAVNIYRELYYDSWAMIDSFRQLFPEEKIGNEITPELSEQKEFLSNVLIKILETDMDEISYDWAENVKSGLPYLNDFMDVLLDINKNVLTFVQKQLMGNVKSNNFNEFEVIGNKLNKMNVSLPEILSALALSRKSIWIHVLRKKLLVSPLEIYTTLELNNRIIFLYDKIIYYLTKGFIQVN